MPARKKSLTRSARDRALIAKRQAEHKKAAAQTSGPKRCSKAKGQILRDAYFRKTKSGERVAVPSTCIKAVGKAASTGSKGKQLFVMEKDVLKPYGYEDIRHKSEEDRQVILRRALKDIPALALFRHLHALQGFFKRKDPALAAKFRQDKYFIQTTREWENRPTNPATKSRKSYKKSHSHSHRRT